MIDKTKLLARLEEIRTTNVTLDTVDDGEWQNVIGDLMDEVEGWAAPHRKLESTTTTVPLDRLLDIGQDEDGSWHVSIVAMPGHVGAADTLEQAVNEATEAAELWIATLNDRITELERRLDARDSYELEQNERLPGSDWTDPKG